MDDLCFIRPLTNNDVISINDQIGKAAFRIYHKRIECLVVLNQTGCFEGILRKEELLKYPDIEDTDSVSGIFNKSPKYIKKDIKEQNAIISEANDIFNRFDSIQQIPVINLSGVPTHFVVNRHEMRILNNIDIVSKMLTDVKSLQVFLAKLKLFSKQHTRKEAFAILSNVMQESCTTKIIRKIPLEDGTLCEVLCDNKQYFPPDIISLKNECFLDCGAYIGDTIKTFLNESNCQFDSIFSFEPNKANYNICLESLLQYEPDIREKIKVFNYGLAENENIFYFPKNSDSGCPGFSEDEVLSRGISIDILLNQ